MILILDNFDSFTYNLVDYFEQIGVEVIVKQNNADLDHIKSLSFNAIVISPGPEIPSKAGITNKIIEYYHDKKPILGICLGHQAIGEFFGWQLMKAKKPRHGKISEIRIEDDYIYKSIPKKINVTRYHSLVLKKTSKELIITSMSLDDNEIMSFKHNSLPICGIQFHPEAILTEYGIIILKNWVIFNNLL